MHIQEQSQSAKIKKNQDGEKKDMQAGIDNRCGAAQVCNACTGVHEIGQAGEGVRKRQGRERAAAFCKLNFKY